MKHAKPTPATKPSPPTASDNLCKLLAERYPGQFAQWAFGSQASKVKILKTELSREPVRADSVIFVSEDDEILHGEFQTTMKSDLPMPLRMLDYYVGLKRQHLTRRIRQVLIVLKPTGTEIPDRYEDEETVHRYRVIKLWEQDPAELLQHAGLLPLATLCRAGSGEKLLGEVAAQIKRIKSREQQRETLNWSRVLAGLRYDRNLINSILKESDMLEESVIYQDILQKGVQQGWQREKNLVLRQLERLLGKLSARTRKQIEKLSIEQVEALGEELVEFKSEKSLTTWLKQHAATR